ncbi:methyltransferase domain-containing protein [Streptomyces albus]
MPSTGSPTGFYTGLIGTVYAAAISEQRFGEDRLFTGLVARADGTALELGSGTGRLLLRLLAAGHRVHGLELSAEMTALCRAQAASLGLDPVVHQGSFAPLDAALGGYAALYCPLNAFSFIVDDDLARESVHSYAAALAPGGILALSGSAGDAAVLRTRTDWVRRPDVPLDGGRTALVEERRRTRDGGRLLAVERTVRVLDPDGRVRTTEEGTQLRRLRPMAELAQLFAEAGFTHLHAYGNDADHVLTGRRR